MRSQAADIVMRLDGDRRPAGEGHALDHIRIERALREKFGAAKLFRLHVEHSMNSLPMILRLASGSSTPASAFEEQILSFDMDQRDVVGPAEQRHHLLGLAEPQQTVIDEYAGELIADRFMDQHGGDRGIDAAGQAADHLALADLRADFRDRLVL